MSIARRLAVLLSAPLELARTTPEKVDAIVVLGAPLRADGSLSMLAEERVRTGVELFERGLAPVLCFVGGHCPTRYRHTRAEAEGMAVFARDAGVPATAIRSDRLSRSTAENAMRAAELLLPEGRRRILLVTQRFHLRRAAWLFRRQGFEVLPFRIEGGVEDRARPRLLFKWVAREYAAFLRLGGTVLLAKAPSNLPSVC